MTRRTQATIFVSLGLAFTATAFSQEGTRNDRAPAFTSGQVAVRDPETGRLTQPTGQRPKRFLSIRGGNAKPLEKTKLPNGVSRVRLNEKYLSFAVVQRDTTGKAKVHCVNAKRVPVMHSKEQQ